MLPLFLPMGWRPDSLLRCLIGVALFSAAYMAEVVRGGLQAMPKGQYEGAQALGLNYGLMMVFIILPQALKMVIPGIVNSFISLFKDTSLVAIVGMHDLLSTARMAYADPLWQAYALEANIAIGLFYFLCCWMISERARRLGHGAGKLG
jgi:general L-amino acid transport system permease protein